MSQVQFFLLAVLIIPFCICLSIPNPFASEPARTNLTAIVLIADGTEELEAVATIDLLRRANVRVTVAGVAGNSPVKCQYGCMITPDSSLDLAMAEGLYDLVVVPGGEQACLLMAQSDLVGKLLTDHVKGERFVAASTAGPTVLDAHRINLLHRLTSSSAFSDKLKKHYSYQDWEETIVDIPGKMITGRFPGTILEFGLSLINHLIDRKAADRVSYQLEPYSTTVG